MQTNESHTLQGQAAYLIYNRKVLLRVDQKSKQLQPQFSVKLNHYLLVNVRAKQDNQSR